MRRLLLAWLLAIPLVAVGSQLAHWLAYSFVATPGEPGDLLAATGHGYLGALPLLVTTSLGLIVAVLVMVAADGFSGRASLRLQRWLFVVVPYTGFLAQDLVERGVAGHAVSLGTLFEGPVLVGLLLQLPFAILVYWIAHVLTRAAIVLGHALASRPPQSLHPERPASWSTRAWLLPRALGVATAPVRGPLATSLLPAT